MKQMAVVPILIGIMILAQAASAQGMRRSPEERAKQLKEQLSLNDEQTKKVTEIYTESQTTVMEKMQEGMGDRDAMREFMTKQTAKVDSQIVKLLTKEQAAKYEDVKKQRQQMRRGRPGQ
jgi:Spy/CpxP family protein refolding chaperone